MSEKLPEWVRPLLKHPIISRTYLPSIEAAKATVEPQNMTFQLNAVETKKLRNLVRKLDPKNPLREVVLDDPTTVPMARLADYIRLAFVSVSSKSSQNEK